MSTKNSSILTKKYKLALSTIHMVYRLINSTFDLKDLLLRLAKFISQILSTKDCQIFLVDDSKKNITLRAVVSSRKKTITEKKTKLGEGINGKIIRKGASLLKDSILAVPLISEDTVGAIIVRRKNTDKDFDLFDREILIAISEQVVTAIRNLRLYEEQQKIVFGSIKSLIMLLDKKIPEEYTHTPVFSQLVLAIAEELNVNESQLHSIEYASLLHDAGKIDIPAEILTKRERLTPEEFGIIKSHPLKGAELIKPLEILRPAIPMILYHHEKYDGTGYPSGLKKGQIPLGARIMAVADAFEAMISGRPYRNTATLKEALDEIKKNSGTQFDPKVVDAFLRVAKKRKFKKYLRLTRQNLYNIK